MAYVDYATKVKAADKNGYVAVQPIPVPADEKQDTGKTEGVTVTVQIGNENYKGTLTKV